MGTIQSTEQEQHTWKQIAKNVPDKHMIVERMIDGSCDFIQGPRNQLAIGICNKPDDKGNPLKTQCIQIGGMDPLDLKSFAHTTDSVIYTFEQDTILHVRKRAGTGEIYYNLKTPNYDVMRQISPIIQKIYKPIGAAAEELDSLKNIMRTSGY